MILALSLMLLWQTIINSSVLAYNWVYMSSSFVAFVASCFLFASLTILFGSIGYGSGSFGVAFSVGPAVIEILAASYMSLVCLFVKRKKINDGLRVTPEEEKLARRIFNDVELYGISDDKHLLLAEYSSPAPSKDTNIGLRSGPITRASFVTPSSSLDAQSTPSGPKIFETQTSRKRKAAKSKRPKNPPPLQNDLVRFEPSFRARSKARSTRPVPRTDSNMPFSGQNVASPEAKFQEGRQVPYQFGELPSPPRRQPAAIDTQSVGGPSQGPPRWTALYAEVDQLTSRSKTKSCDRRPREKANSMLEELLAQVRDVPPTALRPGAPFQPYEDESYVPPEDKEDDLPLAKSRPAPPRQDRKPLTPVQLDQAELTVSAGQGIPRPPSSEYAEDEELPGRLKGGVLQIIEELPRDSVLPFRALPAKQPPPPPPVVLKEAVLHQPFGGISALLQAPPDEGQSQSSSQQSSSRNSLEAERPVRRAEPSKPPFKVKRNRSKRKPPLETSDDEKKDVTISAVWQELAFLQEKSSPGLAQAFDPVLISQARQPEKVNVRQTQPVVSRQASVVMMQPGPSDPSPQSKHSSTDSVPIGPSTTRDSVYVTKQRNGPAPKRPALKSAMRREHRSFDELQTPASDRADFSPTRPPKAKTTDRQVQSMLSPHEQKAIRAKLRPFEGLEPKAPRDRSRSRTRTPSRGSRTASRGSNRVTVDFKLDGEELAAKLNAIVDPEDSMEELKPEYM